MQCPPYGRKCNICFKTNHFAYVLQRKTVKAVNIKDRSTSENNSENECFLRSIKIKYGNKNTVSSDEINTTDLDSVELKITDPEKLNV